MSEDKLFEFKIIAANGEQASLKASYMQIRCESGWRGIMKNNGPLYALLDHDNMYYDDERGVRKFININDGVLRVKSGKVEILTKGFELLSEGVTA